MTSEVSADLPAADTSPARPRRGSVNRLVHDFELRMTPPKEAPTPREKPPTPRSALIQEKLATFMGSPGQSASTAPYAGTPPRPRNKTTPPSTPPTPSIMDSDNTATSTSADESDGEGSPILTSESLKELRGSHDFLHRRSKSSMSSNSMGSFGYGDAAVEEEDPADYYSEPLQTILNHDEEWSHFEDEEGEFSLVRAEDRQIRAATLDKLVQCITVPSAADFDPAVLDALLLTYRGFTTATTLVDALRRRFNTPPGEDARCPGLAFAQWRKSWLIPMRFRVCQVLKTWMERHSYDFKDPVLQEVVQRFVEEISAAKGTDKMGAILRTTTKRFFRKCETVQEEVRRRGKSDVPKPKYPPATSILGLKKTTYDDTPILDWPAVELARQLTLIEHDKMGRILPRECLNQAWNKENREEKAPHIFDMIQWTNTVGLWVGDAVLKEEGAKERAKVVARFVELAMELRRLNNFNGLFGIMGGLNSNSVHRLKLTWEAVPGKTMKTFKELEELMDSNFSYRQMRRAMTEGGVPCIPYIGVYLTDLTFIEDANPDRISNGLINFSKCRLLHDIIKEIQRYQTAPYSLTDVPELRSKLEALSPKDSETLYKLSLEREPRQKKPAKS